MKKNLFFFLPNFSAGGAGKSILNMCKKINRKKFNLHIISIKKNFYKKKFQNAGCKVYEINTTRTVFAYYFIIKDIISKFSKRSVIFISNINYANTLSTIYLKIFNSYPLVLTERTPIQELNYGYGLLDKIKKLLIKILMILIYRKSDLVICNSKKISSDIKKYTGSNTEFIYPILEKKKKFKIIRPRGKFRIISIGRLSIEKKFNDIIKAISKINKSEIELVLLGDGPEKEKLIKNIKLFSLKAKVLPYSDFKEKKYLSKSNLFINSSDFEGFPNAVVSSINNSVPVISTRSHGGINEILLNGKGGFFYDQSNIDQLSNLIVYIKKNYSLAIKKTKKSHKKLNRFSANENIKKFERLIDKIK